MADQTAMTKANGHAPLRDNLGSDRSPDASTAESGANAVVSNVAGFGEDLLNLAELQARLTALEARQNLDVVKTGGALIATGLLVAVAGLPVGLVGIAELLVSEMGLKRGYALLIVAAVAILIAGSCVSRGRIVAAAETARLPIVRRGIGSQCQLGSNRAPPERAIVVPPLTDQTRRPGARGRRHIQTNSCRHNSGFYDLAHGAVGEHRSNIGPADDSQNFWDVGSITKTRRTMWLCSASHTAAKLSFGPTATTPSFIISLTGRWTRSGYSGIARATSRSVRIATTLPSARIGTAPQSVSRKIMTASNTVLKVEQVRGDGVITSAAVIDSAAFHS